MRFLAKLYVDGYLSAEDGLQSAGQVAKDTAAPDGNATDDAKIAGNAMAIQSSTGGYHGRVYHIKGF